MGRGKRGQMFLLAAVIISAIVVSFAFTANEARVNQEPENFADLSYEVKKETGAVMDYQVYTGFNDDANLTEFVDKLAEDLYDRDSGVNFMFIYGNSSNVTLRNYGSKTANVNDDPVRGAGTQLTSRIGKGGIHQDLNESLKEYDHTDRGRGKSWIAKVDNVDYVEVEVSGQRFNVSFSQNKQVIFIIQKEVGDENYISVK
jgi:hypothetical protein